jgi:hypothetical protein
MKKKIVLYLFLFFLGYQKNMAQINQKDSIDLVIDLVKIDFKKYDFNHFSKEFGKKKFLNPTFVIWEKETPKNTNARTRDRADSPQRRPKGAARTMSESTIRCPINYWFNFFYLAKGFCG